MTIPLRYPKYITAIALFLTIVSAAQAQYSSGTGEPNDPYQIATAADLIALGETPEDYDKHFILTADIDLDPNLPGRKVFDKAVIAPAFRTEAYPYMQGAPFTGVLDGNGYTISHLTINGTSHLGLFGYSAQGTEVKNLGIVDVNITGSDLYVGGLVGYDLRGQLTECYSTGTVTGDNNVGGLVGRNDDGSIVASYSTSRVSGNKHAGGLVGVNSGSIATSYSNGSVSGTDAVGGLVGANSGRTVSIVSSYSSGSVRGTNRVGGLVGINWGSIATSYSSGSVSGTGSVGGLVGHNANDRQLGLLSSISNCYSAGEISGSWDVGGLVGSGTIVSPLYAHAVIPSFWDTEASGQAVSSVGISKTTTEMQMESTFTDAGWDFVGETANGIEDIWKIAEGLGYPRLAWEKYGGGIGELNDPYQIATAADLIALGETPDDYDKHFILTADIDLDPNLPGRKVFDKAVIAPDTVPNDLPHEFQGVPFIGVFDGNGHTIARLAMTGIGDLGLLGVLGSGAEVKNLGVVDVNIIGSGNEVGGLVGYNDHGSVNCCYSTGMVTGNSDVGGLVGRILGGGIVNSYSTAAVAGNGGVGGLAGANRGGIRASYSTGAVAGYSNVGGLVGMNYAGATWYGWTNSSYWDIETSGQTISAGGWGRTTTEMQTADTFLTPRTDKAGKVYAGWDFVGETENGMEDIWWFDEGKDYPRLWWENAEQ